MTSTRRFLPSLLAVLLMCGALVSFTTSTANAAPAVAPVLTGPATATGQVAVAFTYTPTVSGTPAPVVDAQPNQAHPDQLPSSLSVNTSTGQITGTPTNGDEGVYEIRLRAQNSKGNDSLIVTITINRAPKINGSNSATGQTGQAFTYTPNKVNGFPAPTVALGPASGPLPSGLTLDSTTGEITGTPADGSGGTYPVQLRATNTAGFDNLNVMITINQAPLITGEPTAAGKAGDSFSYAPTMLSGFPPPTVTSSTLPSGLSLNSATGAISGIPATTAHGMFTVVLTASNGVDPDASLTVTITIDKDDIEGLAPSITGLAKVGQTLTANSGPVIPANATLAYQWNASGHPISSATGSTYTLKKAQVGKEITVTITATDPDYNPETATSSPTANVRELVKRPQIALDKSTAAPGSTVTIEAKGLTPGDTYTVRLDGTTILTATADTYGEINDTATIPAGAKSGIHIITLTGGGTTASTILVVT